MTKLAENDFAMSEKDCCCDRINFALCEKSVL